MSIKIISSKLLICSSLIFSTCNSLQAADKNEVYAVKGAGVSYCSTFLESMEARDKNYFIYGGWVEGYLTALNQQLADTFDLAPWQTTELMLKMIEPVCQQNPEQQFHNVVKAMAGQFSEHKITESSNYVQLETNKNLVFQESVIKRIKNALMEKGLYEGDDDLSWGGEVTTAIKEFQHSQDLEETGTPDQVTLYKLFYGKN